MEGRLSKSLQEKIAKFDIAQPYVWRLRLSVADFNELETCLISIIAANGVFALSEKEHAITTIIYLAEWYKRRYQSGNKNDLIEGLDLSTLWENSGISQKRFLYRDESGSQRRLYSIYVLGGLAIHHELNRNDNMKFLKGLCRIYHGEDYTLENLDDASRAVAFRESIKRQHSLYEYMRDILNGQMPFHQNDLQDELSDVNRFVATIKAANDEILKVKFRFEWLVTFSPEYTHMTRRLNVWLKPEEVGGGLHQYLRYDRVHLWGVPHPESQQHLEVYIRYKNGEETIEPSTMERPIISYLNHSVNDFVAFGVERGVQVKHVPANQFDRIEIVVKDDGGHEYIAQTQFTSEYMQLWQSQSYQETWTSTPNAQRQTALLFSNRCHLKEEMMVHEVYRKNFRDPVYGMSETWNWIYIYDSVAIIDYQGKEVNLFNRIGYDQVTTRLYADTIQYVEGGRIRYRHIEDPDISNEPDTDLLPVIFCKEDIIVRHFATKDDIRNAQPVEDTVADMVEYKRDNHYKLWTTEDRPPYGVNSLRVTVKGKPHHREFVFLPKMNEDSPIQRDFEQTCVRFRKMDNEIAYCQDKIPMDGAVLQPTIPIKYGQETNYFEIDVYRPTLIKEVMLDEQIIDYLDGNEQLELPYIFKQRVQLNDFSRNGYQSYECKNLGSIYTPDFLNIAKNPSVGMAALFAWSENRKYQGKLLDPIAPESLVVCFGREKSDANWAGKEALFWNYDCHQEPMVTPPDEEPEFGIIFQNLSKSKNLTCNYPIQADDDPWGFDDVDVSILKCFEVANETGSYFFLMKPLMEMSRNDIIKELYEPLIKMRGGELTEKDRQGLVRFGEEFGFDWQTHHIYLDN